MSETQQDSCCCGKAPLPKVTFSAFVISLASSALVCMGEVPDPATGKSGKDLDMARHNIEILEMLRQKTRNGLDKSEKDLLENLICELKLKFVLKCD